MAQGSGRLPDHRAALAPSRWQPAHASSTLRTAFISRAIKTSGTKRFFSDYVDNAVYVYSVTGRRDTHIATLTGFTNPAGLATDTSGSLYVANEGAANILVYAPPYTGTPTTLNDPGQLPIDVAVDSHGNVAACNLYSTSYGPASVSFYAAGSTNPTSTISTAAIAEIYFCAFDANGNLYLDGYEFVLGAGGGFGFYRVVAGEIAGGINGTAITALKTGNTINYPGGVQVTTGGQIAIMDQGPGPAIYTYNPPESGSLGSPVATTSLGGSFDPVTFVFDKTAKRVFTADAESDSWNEYAYPAGGSPLHSHPLPRGGLPIGVAITPTEQY